ncbi:MAG TPA: haloacid dehalogenase-like hydrolase, partial [Candidatus Hypogeohydataceae bacterium YC38]
MKRPKLIVFDLDGVIFRGQYLLRLSRHVGIVNYLCTVIFCLLFDLGRLSIDDLLRKVYRGFKGVSLEKLWQVYREMPLIENAQEVIKELKVKGYHVIIISSGVPDFLVQDMSKRLGADLGFGIETGVLDGMLSGEVGGMLSTGEGKHALMNRLLKERGLAWKEAIVVADDPNNLPIMERAGVSIGVNSTYPVRKKAQYLVDSNDLRDVAGIIERGNKPIDLWEDWLMEARRKMVHVFTAGVPFMAGIAFLPTIVSLCGVMIVYAFSEWVRLNGKVLPLVGNVTLACIRMEERRGFVWGPITIALGVITTLILFPTQVAIVAIWTLAFADSAATLVGRVFGSRRIPYNKSKSIQGSVALFLVA